MGDNDQANFTRWLHSRKDFWKMLQGGYIANRWFQQMPQGEYTAHSWLQKRHNVKLRHRGLQQHTDDPSKCHKVNILLTDGSRNVTMWIYDTGDSSSTRMTPANATRWKYCTQLAPETPQCESTTQGTPAALRWPQQMPQGEYTAHRWLQKRHNVNLQHRGLQQHTDDNSKCRQEHKLLWSGYTPSSNIYLNKKSRTLKKLLT
jgi:hypothetical protein